MTRAQQPSGLHPSIVLAAYIEPLVRGRRVALLGDATIGLAEELSERGARLVHAYDPDPARVAEALARSAASRPHQVTHAVLADDLGVRDGAFDVVVVPDLSILPDAADVIRRTRRLVAQSGAAVFVAPNQRSAQRRLLPAGTIDPKALGYYELFDLVSLQFAKVRMIGQAPFVGYTVADFAPNGEPEVSVDTSLLTSSEEPEHFIAVASDRAVMLEAFTVVELPWSEVSDALGSEGVPTPRPGALAEAEQRLALATAELEKLRAQKADDARDAEGRAAKWAALSARVGELEGEVERRDARLKEVEARAGDSHVRAERQTHQIRDLEEELVRQRDRGTRLSKQLDDEKKIRTKVEVELGMLRGRPEIAGGKDRIDALGAELDAARARIAELEHEHATTKRRGEAQASNALPPPIVLPPPPAAPDPKLLHRLNELEQAVNAALREAAEAASQRDAAIDRARKAEARIERVTEVEGTLETLRHEKGELLEHAGVLETRGSEAERRLGDAERQLVDAEKRAAVLVAERDAASQRAASAEQRASEVVQLAKRAENEAAEGARQRIEADRRAAEAEKRRADAAAKLGAAEAKIGELERLAEERGARLAEVSRALDEVRQRAEEAGADRAALDAATAEIAALEAALYDRGRVVAALSRDLRESERIGRELLGDLDEARATNGVHVAAEAPTPGDALDLRGRLDALAANAARCEADLTAARWRIAQLERELAETPGRAREPTAIERELEQALAAARDELASLRRGVAGS